MHPAKRYRGREAGAGIGTVVSRAAGVRVAVHDQQGE